MKSVFCIGNMGGGIGLVGKMINWVIFIFIIMWFMGYGGGNVKNVE